MNQALRFGEVLPRLDRIEIKLASGLVSGQQPPKFNVASIKPNKSAVIEATEVAIVEEPDVAHRIAVMPTLFQSVAILSMSTRSAMDIQISNLTIDPLGRLLLDGLPFSPGQHVDVVVRPHEPETSPSVNLAGSVLRYDRPLDPVVDGDWESAS
jgi:hypothetical protein